MAAGVSLLGLVPLGYVVVTAILTGGPTLSALVLRPRVGELLAMRATGDFPLKPLRHGAFGGVLRRAWDRKRALGRFDRSWSGLVALAIGMPVRSALIVLRRVRGRRARARLAGAETIGEQ